MFKEICKGFYWFIGSFSYSESHQRLLLIPQNYGSIPAKAVLLAIPATVQVLGIFPQIGRWISLFSTTLLKADWNNRKPVFFSMPLDQQPWNLLARGIITLSEGIRRARRVWYAGHHMCTKPSVVSLYTHS